MGDHSMCIPGNCPALQSPEPEPAPLEPTDPDPVEVGTVWLDEAQMERYEKALGMLGPNLGGFRPEKAVLLSLYFGVRQPWEVVATAEQLLLAAGRVAELASFKPRGFGLPDLLADDWRERLNLALQERTWGEEWKPFTDKLTSEAGVDLRRACTAGLPLITTQIERWLAANLAMLAQRVEPPNQQGLYSEQEWRGRANYAWKYSDAVVGPAAIKLPGRFGWFQMFKWDLSQYTKLVERTRPNLTLAPGDTIWKAAHELGAEVSFATSAREVQDRHREVSAMYQELMGIYPTH